MGETLRAQNQQRKGGKAPGADNWRELKSTCESYLDVQAMDKVCRAYEFARECHGAQRRRSGEPYINHPVDVALILASLLHMDEEPICAAILHDTVEDTDATLDDLAEQFGQTVADLVDGVTKLTQVEVSSLDEKQAFNLRKMFLAMSKDIRVLIIKLADRLHNMRTMAALPPEKRVIKSRETMDVYAPLADRLGISSIKWELEDLAFFYLMPEDYERVARMVQESRAHREERTAEAIRQLEEVLAKEGITNVQISGRPKHLWSIYQKMTRKRKDFSQIYDLIALRVLTETVADCYSVLGTIHSLWHPVPGRFKDYVAMPKANGYQSLHTTVIGSEEVGTVEIQIRTHEMHDKAEYGIAAHWLYKRAGNSRGEMSAEDRSVDTQINWIRRTLDWTMEEEIEDPHEFLNSLRVDLFEHEIFVFTPKGDVMSLRRESTPLDFAYAVHTQVGNHCTGAKVNGVMVPLTYKLKSGDRVEIITNKNAKPGHDWLKMVVTPSARSKIRKYFATATKEDDAERGRGYLAMELRRFGLGISSSRVAKALEKACESSDFHDVETMLAAVGTNRMSPKQLAHKIDAIISDARPASEVEREERKASKNAAIEQDKPLLPHKTRDRRRQSSCGVVVKGDPDLLVHLAHCCNPVAGDEIVGFITRGRGVRVHRASCPNLHDLMKHPERLIEVEWDTSGATEFQVEIVVEANDRMGLLKDVTIALDEAGCYILSAATQSGPNGIARLRFLIALSDASLLGPLLARVSHVPSVYGARRILPGEGAKQLKKRQG